MTDNNSKNRIVLLLIIILCQCSYSADKEDNDDEDDFEFGVNKSSITDKIALQNSVLKSKLDFLGETLKANINAFKKFEKLDVVFLIDGSSTVGEQNFKSELKFVKKILSDISVDFDRARIAIITFSSKRKIVKNVDQITHPVRENNKCLFLNKELNQIKFPGGGTYTLGAFEFAKKIFDNSRLDSKKVLFLITDGYSNGGDPIPIANELKKKNITIFTIGVKHGNYEELYKLSSSSEGNLYSFLVDSFLQFENLARRALHVDIKGGKYVPLGSDVPCNSLCPEGKDCCDENALCTCGTVTGHYTCLCGPGYYGSGFKNSCSFCPLGSYSDGPNLCLSCPDVNHVSEPPAIGVESCVCKPGYQATQDNKCEVVKCPKLKPPLHGYFVKSKECGETLNNACGIRCEVGYALSGSSIRLCQQNATWSGLEPACRVKTCSALPAPKYGSLVCFNSDLGIAYNGSESRYPVDTICKFECDKGRLLTGSSHRNCLPIGLWDGLVTSCKKVSCNKLSPIPHGKIEPKSCTKTKQVYGRTCNYSCFKGFEVVGPTEITCTGKSWNKRKQPTICKDVAPPEITCPNNIQEYTLEGTRFGLVSWEEPKVIDNSGMEIKIWLQPAVGHTRNVKFSIGITNLTYFAEDVFKNKGNCTFSVEIKDKEPPQIQNCVDPPIYLLSKEQREITWDEPDIFDNSGNVTVIKSHGFGIFDIGTTQVVYTAVDPSNNTNTCTLNVTVEDSRCEPLPDPENGKSVCETFNSSFVPGMQCIVTCEDGYALPLNTLTDSSRDDGADDDAAANATYFSCTDDDPLYYYSSAESVADFPGCTVTAVPSGTSIEGVVNVEPEEDEAKTCEKADELNDMKNDIRNNLVVAVAADSEDVNVTADVVCEEESDLSEDEEQSNVIKREAETKIKKKKKKKKKPKRKMIIRFEITTLLNITDNNVEDINKELKNITTIGGRKVNVLGVNVNKRIRCPLGFIRKRYKCVKCPLGTFHDTTKNSCSVCPLGTYNDEVGRTTCKPCPPEHSTRRFRSKSASECKAHCPPGTMAKKKTVRLSKRHPDVTVDHVSLMPFCISCPIGFYQPEYGKTKCLACPKHFTTYAVRSDSEEKCVPTAEHICNSYRDICNGGECVPVNEFQYKCTCPDTKLGSNCEKNINLCDSNPCLNGGHCFTEVGTVKEGYVCRCPEGYTGTNCEEIEEKCNRICYNNGTCAISEEEEHICVCPAGYVGDSCETKLSYCREDSCENNGTCVEEPDSFRCICKDGFLGKRCHILPCDYRPCASHKVCENIKEPNATRESYRCVCPEGFEGDDCKTKVHACEKNPCLNNGTCVPSGESYYCKCGTIFNGTNCELKMDNNYLMHFRYPVVTTYVKLQGFSKNLEEVSVCLWIKTSDAFNYGTIFSYATRAHDNAFTAMDYTGLVLYINGQYAVTDVYLNDGFWHFLCITWNNRGVYHVYVDGVQTKRGEHFAKDNVIEANGSMVIGQEQDELGSNFSQTEAFVGKIAFLDFWSRELTHEEVKNFMNSCNEEIFGDLYSWAEMRNNIRGNVEIEDSSFCKSCPNPPPLTNGVVETKDNKLIYKCNAGFTLYPPEYSAGRKCLKSQQWEGKETPSCRKVYCGYPGYLPNGITIGRGFFYGDRVMFRCLFGYTLLGSTESVCTEDGSWKPGIPYCVGYNDCTEIEQPENAEMTIVSDESSEITNRKSFEPGTTIEITCTNNTILEGQSILTCLETGHWDHSPPKCVVPKGSSWSCSVDNIPSAPKNGFIVPKSLEDYNDGLTKEIFYKCRQGYQLVGNNSTSCITDGYWSNPNVTCKPMECVPPPEFPKMKKQSPNKTYVFGNAVTYECEDGYKVFGSNVIRCSVNRKWTKMHGKCIRISCYKPQVSESTVIEGSSYLFEDQVTLTCPSGKKFKITCTSSGKWAGDRGSDC